MKTAGTDATNPDAEISSDSHTRRIAADKVRAFFRRRFTSEASQSNEHPFHAAYLPNFAFEDARYIIISTRNRGYKNILRVVEAANILVRQRQFNVKVLLTGYFDKDIEDYVTDKCLQYDVIPLFHVPADIHAYLYYLAGVCVHPSFFEGGFPFVFSESLSVGTPVILANVPTVTEAIDPAINGDFLFDRYPATNIADKIQYALENRDQLLNRQQELLAVMKERTWMDVANEYVTVFEKASLIWSDSGNPAQEDQNSRVKDAAKTAQATHN